MFAMEHAQQSPRDQNRQRTLTSQHDGSMENGEKDTNGQHARTHMTRVHTHSHLKTNKSVRCSISLDFMMCKLKPH